MDKRHNTPRFVITTFALFLFGLPLWAQHEHAPAAPEPPVLQPKPGGTTLAELEALALENNPTLLQAAAEVRITEGRRRQAGLWPNPVVGYTGEEIRGGSFQGGEHGFFIEQQVLLGGKLRAAQNVVEHERVQALSEADEQKERVLNGVRILYYQTLAAQANSEVQRRLSDLANEAAKVTRQLVNAGQADQTDQLQAEIEAQHAELALIAAQNQEDRLWQELALTTGRPELKRATLAGSLDADLPDLDSEPWLNNLLEKSPPVQIAEHGIERARALVEQAKKTAIPDLNFRAGWQYNRELLDGTTKPVGSQGFASVGITLPIFNRAQGSKAAAEAEVLRAKKEAERVQLLLRERAAGYFQGYRTSRAMAERYRDQILPRAKQAFEAFEDRYHEMYAAYPQALVAKRTWYQSQAGYIAALSDVWTNALALRGSLLTDGLEAPARSGEMDRPVREVNLPSSRGASDR